MEEKKDKPFLLIYSGGEPIYNLLIFT